MLAIVETGGKQYEMTEGRYVDIELLDANVEDSFVFDKVVMIVAGEQTKVGQPYVEGAEVKGKILNHGKDAKVIIYKQRCKKGYRKKQGHRQGYTRIMIENIEFPGKEAVLAATTVEEKPKTKAKATKTAKASGTKKTTKTAKAATKTAKTEEAPKTKKAAAPKKAEKASEAEAVKPEVEAKEVETKEAIAETQETKSEE